MPRSGRNRRWKKLTDAQERTDQKMESLAGAMEELADAQKQTEKEMAKLSGSMRGTRG